MDEFLMSDPEGWSGPEAPRPKGSSTRGGPTPAAQERLGSELEGAAGFDAVFRVVRRAVRSVLQKERPGLGLALSDLPPELGAYWQVTGNVIVVNEGLFRTMRAQASSDLEYNAFAFVILAHEYLHALGYLDESGVREVTARVAREAFGAQHPVSQLAAGDLWQRFPFLRMAPGGHGRHLRMVPGFDRETTSNYIR